MKKINFLVDSNYALDVGGQHIDLHNNFDFKGLEYSTNSNQVCLSWIKSVGDWVPTDEVEGFKIIFENALLLKVQGSISEVPSTRKNLSFIGYLHPEDVELMDGCLDESEATSDHHMIFVFENNFAIKIFSDTAEYKIGS